jgi:uncharacterized cupin superfamily protein
LQKEAAAMPKLDLANIPVRSGTIYPAPYAEQMTGRHALRLGDAGGLTQFGANIIILAPGARSSLRHWHLNEDEFVMVTQGECTLVQDAGETLMQTGDCAAFPAGSPDGHCFLNHTKAEARFLVIGTKSKREVVTYSDVDLKVDLADGAAVFTHWDGRPYAPKVKE